MDVKIKGRNIKGAVRLQRLTAGQVFRSAEGGSTLWMKVRPVASVNIHKQRQDVPVVSLIVGNLSHKQGDMLVVPVAGTFVVDEWFEGADRITTLEEDE